MKDQTPVSVLFAEITNETQLFKKLCPGKVILVFEECKSDSTTTEPDRSPTKIKVGGGSSSYHLRALTWLKAPVLNLADSLPL